MSIGLPAFHTAQVPLQGDSDGRRQAVSSAIAAMKWTVRQGRPGEIVAGTSANASPFGQRVIVTGFNSGLLTVRSQCSFLAQFFDLGRNKANVGMLVAELRRRAAVSGKSG